MTPKEIEKIQGKMDYSTFGALIGVSSVTAWRWAHGEAHPEGASLRLLELLRDDRDTMIKLLSKRAQKGLSVESINSMK